MQSISSRIWTRVIVSISYDDNHYTRGTSKTFYYLWVKRFFDIRREIYILSILAFPSAPTPITCAPATRPRRAKDSQPSSSEAGTQLTDFFQIPPNPPRTLLVHDVIHIPKFYQRFLFWYLWMTHPPRVRVNTCAHVAPN